MRSVQTRQMMVCAPRIASCVPAALGSLCRGTAALALSAQALLALDASLSASGPSELAERLRSTSLTLAAAREGQQDPGQILAIAQADYSALLATLYRQGYFAPVISIRLDGREAADFPAFAEPPRLARARIRVDPGPSFRFGLARVAPLAAGTSMPAGFATGKLARFESIETAATAAIDAWRAIGHAKAGIASQDVLADHRTRRIDADIVIAPGPTVSFGALTVEGAPSVRRDRIAAIAGLTPGETFSTEELDRVARRLRNTGAFSSVVLTEDPALGPGNSMDIHARLVAEKPRRLGFGAEINSLEGIAVNAYWMHRNIFGGAENLRFDASIAGIGSSTSGLDKRIALRFSRPGTLAPENTLVLDAAIEALVEPAFRSTGAMASAILTRELSQRTVISGGVGLRHDSIRDDLGRRDLLTLSLPLSARNDRRDNLLDPRTGTYVALDLMPLYAIGADQGGIRAQLDLRGYTTPGAGDGPLTLAARVQVGTIIGSRRRTIPPDLLFFSGGGGTVRGQPYQSLGLRLPNGDVTGGTSFLGLSGEARYKFSGAFSLVAFADYGQIGSNAIPGATGRWHGGAGLGLRYDTGLGPIRLDVAAPIGIQTAGAQFYLGIGQAF